MKNSLFYLISIIIDSVGLESKLHLNKYDRFIELLLQTHLFQPIQLPSLFPGSHQLYTIVYLNYFTVQYISIRVPGRCSFWTSRDLYDIGMYQGLF